MSLEITVFLEITKYINVLTLVPNIPFECFMRAKIEC